MTIYSKPSLPDPGGGRYWIIEASDGYFTLKLMIDGSDTVYRLPKELASSGYLVAKDVNEQSFETIAATLLDTVDKNSAFVGEYRFEETN